MSKVTRETVERVREAADIVEIVSAYTDLRRAGGRFTGLCPFHDERTPSFSVNQSDKLYYCFGCGVGGDVFGFLQEKEGLEFRDAVEQLADRYGVEIAFDKDDPQAEQRRKRRERLFTVVDKTATFYRRYLVESDEAGDARKYLEGRGLGEKILEEFGVGYAPSAWDRILMRARQAGFSEQELVAAGLVQRNQQGRVYDRFRGRIIFPLRDSRGRVHGFGARALRDNQQPKYLNSPEGEIYHKGNSLFGIDLARPHATKSGEVIVVEGYTDALALHQAGIRNVVAAMGTAMTEEQVAELARLGKTVILAFDADVSGQDAMLKVQKAAAGRGIDLKVVRLPDDKDPCDLLQEAGPDAFGARVREASSFLEFQVATLMERADTSTAAAKDRVVAQLGPILGQAPEGAERDELIRRVAGKLQLDERWLAPALARKQPAPQGSSPSSGRQVAPRPTAASRFERPERIYLALCMSSGEMGKQYLERMTDDHFSSDLLRKARRWLAENFDEPTQGLGGDDDLARVVSEIVVRASAQPQNEYALQIDYYGLEQRRLDRALDRAAREQDFDRQRELSVERSEITEKIATLMNEAQQPSSVPRTGSHERS